MTQFIYDAPPRSCSMLVRTALETLGLSAGPALPDERALRRAYRKASLKHHPDRNLDDPEGSKARFLQVGEAYATIVRERDGQDDGGGGGRGG